MKLKHPQYMESAWRHTTDTKGVGGYFTMAYKNKAHVPWKGTDTTFATSVSPIGEVVIAPHGSLCVSSMGSRDPDWRHEMEVLLGVKFDLAKKFAGKLFCPHTKQKVQVSRIEGNPELWCDREHGVALRAGQITYASPDSPPVRSPELTLNYSIINRKRTKAFMPRWKKLVNEGKVRMSMMEPRSAPIIVVHALLVMLATTPDAVDIESAVRFSQKLGNASSDELMLTYQLCRTLTANAERANLKDLISYACADHYKSTYLEYRP